MVAVKLDQFGGQIPGIDDRLLPQNNASLAQNCWLYEGTLDGIRKAQNLFTMVNPFSQRVFRIPKHFPDKDHMVDSYWLEFTDPDVNVVPPLIAEDTYQRYYWAGPNTPPTYNTLANIASGGAALTLGIPTPETAPTVTPPSGGTIQEVRSYMYTWVSAYGEEGPPSPPTVTAPGDPAGSWSVHVTGPLSGDTTGRNLSFTNIYRSVTSSLGVGTFQFVAQIAIGSATYTDTILDAAIANNVELPSLTWTGPPTNLQGMTIMPNGIIAGFVGNEIWFCEPYRPHAWPADYALSVPYTIVGMGVIGQTLIVLTTSFPYACTGTAPASMTLAIIPALEPCVSRGSIVADQTGVYYASPNGLCVAAQGAIQNLTMQNVPKNKWQDLNTVYSLRAVKLGSGYYAWATEQLGDFDPSSFLTTAFEAGAGTGGFTGFLLEQDQRLGYVELNDAVEVVNVLEDIWTSEIFLLRNGIVEWLDISENENRTPYLWCSKLFQTGNKKNFEAMKIFFTVPSTLFLTLGTQNTSQTQTFDPTTQYGIVRVFADGRQVMVREIRTSGEQMRLPSGFSADFWQVQIEAQIIVNNIQLATSARELETI